MAHIQQIFDRLRDHSLRLKLKKCSVLKAETNYLGFVINENGIKPEARKVDVIKALAPPTTERSEALLTCVVIIGGSFPISQVLLNRL